MGLLQRRRLRSGIDWFGTQMDGTEGSLSSITSHLAIELASRCLPATSSRSVYPLFCASPFSPLSIPYFGKTGNRIGKERNSSSFKEDEVRSMSVANQRVWLM